MQNLIRRVRRQARSKSTDIENDAEWMLLVCWMMSLWCRVDVDMCQVDVNDTLSGGLRLVNINSNKVNICAKCTE